MKRFDTRTYSISDFIEWRDRSILDYSPDFQRRYVWSDKAKSYLADTVVRELPMPKIIVSQTFAESRQVRVVVDGQQRIRTLLEFYDNKFPIKRMHNSDYPGRYFGDLPLETQQTFLKYELGVDVLFDASYEELIEIFARINTYTVKLNAQELRNALYLGYFKQYAYSIGKSYASYWVGSKVLKTGAISRMAEAELASNLLIICLKGIDSNKSVDAYYKKLEDKDDGLPEGAKQFSYVMSIVAEIYPGKEMGTTIWSGEPLFYSLFAAISNSLKKMELPEGTEEIPPFDTTNPGRLRVALDSLSAEFQITDEEDFGAVRPELARFIDISRRRTADLTSRIDRTRFIAEYILERQG